MNFETRIAEAQGRAKRRKSKWNLLLIPLGLISIAVTWFLLANFIASVHRLYYPSQHFGQSKSNLGGILMFVPILVPSITVGFMLSNCIIWCILPARKVLDQEAKGVKGASFRKSMRDLAIITAVVLPIALLLGFLGAIDPF